MQMHHKIQPRHRCVSYLTGTYHIRATVIRNYIVFDRHDLDTTPAYD